MGMLRRHPLLAAFVLIYLVLFTTLALRRGSNEFLIYAGVMVALILGIGALHNRVRFSTTTLWGLAIWGFLHMAGGTVMLNRPDDPSLPGVLYNFRPLAGLPRYDQIVHAFGFAVATVASYESLRAAFRGQADGRLLRPSAGLCLAAGLMGVGLGAANEVIEFATTLVLESTGVGGADNTGWDLVSNMTGAFLAAVWIYFTGGPRSRPSE